MIKYMGDASLREKEFKEINRYEISNPMAVSEIIEYNKYPEIYKGNELLFRINIDDNTSLKVIKNSKKTIDYLEKKFKSALEASRAEHYFSDSFIKNGIAICMDVTPKDKNGETVLDISLKYITFNPWCAENLADNKVCNGRPKDMLLSADDFESDLQEVHIGYFPQTKFEMNDISIKDFGKSFTEKFMKSMKKFRDESELDFKKNGDNSFFPENVLDGNGSETLITGIASVMGSSIISDHKIEKLETSLSESALNKKIKENKR